MKIKLQIEGLAELNKQFAKKSEQINRGANEGLKNVGLQILAEAQEKLKSGRKSTTGGLFDSGKVKDLKDNSVEVVFDKEYASAVEFGRKAGLAPPPYRDILAWVNKRGILDTFSIKTKRRTKRGNDFQKRLTGLAIAIAKSIGKRGIKPFPFLYPALRNNEAKVERVLKNEIKKYL